MKVSHRKILDGMLSYCGAPIQDIAKFKSFCSAIDKLDKVKNFDKINIKINKKCTIFIIRVKVFFLCFCLFQIFSCHGKQLEKN